MFLGILLLICHIIPGIAVFYVLGDKGYPVPISAMLAILSIVGGIIVFLIVISLPDVVDELGDYDGVSKTAVKDWNCPNCGKVNSGLFKVCECGQRKLEESSNVEIQ